MLRIAAIAIACVFCTVGAAFADIEIWAGGDITPPPTINHDLNTIEIEAAGTYGFRAWDGVDTLEEIQSITVDSGVTGDVTVTIAWDEYGGDGATDLWTGNLTHATYAVYLAGLEISGSLGTTAAGFTCEDVSGNISVAGSIAIGGNVTCGDVGGNIDIGGNLGNLGSPYTEFSANDVTGSITISGYLWDDVTVNTLADFTVEDSGSMTVTGDIAIAQGYSGTMTIADALSGDITVGGEMSGLIDLNRNMVNGSITIGAPGTNANLTGEIDVRAGATIVVNGNVSSSGLIDGQTFLNKAIHVTGDLSGEIVVVYEIASTGRIDIGGSVTSTGSIDVGTFVAGGIDIGVDLDGQIDIAGDLDKPGRIVVGDDVGQTDATTPAIHIHGSIDGEEDEDPEDPMIEVGGELDGVIAIDGDLENAVTNGPEMRVGSVTLMLAYWS